MRKTAIILVVCLVVIVVAMGTAGTALAKTQNCNDGNVENNHHQCSNEHQGCGNKPCNDGNPGNNNHQCGNEHQGCGNKPCNDGNAENTNNKCGNICKVALVPCPCYYPAGTVTPPGGGFVIFNNTSN